jgi:alkanesulfonate monooxygenase SsuD/methylene tetrahydromethanopterin reductase-like flavin-dependent oxidoreductase (luciferase family)
MRKRLVSTETVQGVWEVHAPCGPRGSIEGWVFVVETREDVTGVLDMTQSPGLRAVVLDDERGGRVLLQLGSHCTVRVTEEQAWDIVRQLRRMV